MSAEFIALPIAIIALFGTMIAPIITNFFAQRQERQKNRHAYILSVVTALIELRAALQYHQLQEWALISGIKFHDISITPEFQNLQFAFGKAFAIMISVDIKEIREKAEIIMDNNNSPDKKLKAIDFALKRLGEEYKIL